MSAFKRLLIPLALVALFVACNGPPPPPPDPCETAADQFPECVNTGGEWLPLEDTLCSCSCPGNQVFQEGPGCQCPDLLPIWDEEAQECKPELPPDPLSCSTPVSLRKCEEYIRHERADELQGKIAIYDQRLIGNGVRNPRFALTHCGPDSADSVWPYNGITAAAALIIIDDAYDAKVALSGEDGESGFLEKLGENHPRCDATKWTRVYGPCWKEWFDITRELTDGCKERNEDGSCREFNSQAEADGPVARLDGVRGACQVQLTP